MKTKMTIKNKFFKSMLILNSCAVFLILSCGSSLAATTGQISQFGITWTFDSQYEYGQFANGDYWVKGPVRIIGINPPSQESAGRMMNGSMINPSPRNGQREGYDSELYGMYHRVGDYAPELNDARPNGQPVSQSNPLVVQNGSSLVSAISNPNPPYGSYLSVAAILTVLNAIPPEGSFRPPYVNIPKTIRFNKRQLNYSILSRLAPVNSTPRLTQQQGDAQKDSVERMFERPWVDHIPSWPARAQHPTDNMPEYGREISTQIGEGALMLHLNFTDQEKETLFIRFVQLGIDFYGILQDGGGENWAANGGHASGRKFPILFAGLALNDPEMKNIGQRSGDYINSGSYSAGNDPSDYIHFGEDDQTFYVSQLDIDVTHGPTFSPDSRDVEMIPYTTGDLGLPEWGIVHANYPQKSNKYWNTAYRMTASTGWAGWALATHVMGIKGLWNHNALFDFMDRYMQVSKDDGPWPGYRHWSRFGEEMWDTYRSSYGQRWVMNNPNDPYSHGHYVGSDPDPDIDPDIGDVDGNGNIDAYDASTAARYAACLVMLSQAQVSRADMNGDGIVSAADAAVIARIAAGIIKTF